MHKTDLNRKKVLVVGATGFIGSRLVERLIRERGTQVRALVSRYRNLSRIARFDIEWVQGDFSDPRLLQQAVEGCQYVFYCAYGNRGNAVEKRMIDVEVPRMLLESCKGREVERFVYLSSLMVYGNTDLEVLDETAPRMKTGHRYGDNKLEAEELIFRLGAQEGIPVTVLRPTAVYGPFAPVWTEDVIKNISTGRVILVDGGGGICNHVFIDDLVDAMMLASENPRAVGEDFLISGADPVTWKTFYETFETIAATRGTVSLSYDEALGLCEQKGKAASSLAANLWNHLRTNAELRTAVKRSREVRGLKQSSIGKWLKRAAPARSRTATAGRRDGNVSIPSDEKPILPLNPRDLAWFRSKTVVSIRKAEKLLGYKPRYRFEDGMAVVRDWAEWARLVQPTHRESGRAFYDKTSD